MSFAAIRLSAAIHYFDHPVNQDKTITYMTLLHWFCVVRRGLSRLPSVVTGWLTGLRVILFKVLQVQRSYYRLID